MSSAVDPAEIIARRSRRRQQAARHPRHGFRRLGQALGAVLSLALAAAVIVLAFGYTQITRDLPSLDPLPVLLGPAGQVRQPSQILDRSGTTILLDFSNPHAAAAQYLPLADIPTTLVEAVLAHSDPAFWEHNGFSATSLNDPRPATLAERVVSEFLLYNEPDSPARALRMRLLAAQATRAFGRDQILEWFLNHADYGQRAYGVDAASRVYFGQPATTLTLAQAALLAAAAEAPALNPLEAPALALENQGRALQAMVTQDYLDFETAVAANAAPLSLQPAAASPISAAPDFTTLLLEQLAPHFPLARLQRGGLRVITSLDADLQDAVACAAAVQAARLQGQQPLNSLAGQDCEAARLLPTLPVSAVLAGAPLAAEVAVLDSRTGHLLALLGNPQRGHTPGTALSPFVYLTAFTRGYGPASLVWDIPASLPPGLEGFTNADGRFHGPLRLRTALANDYVVPALQILSQVGAANVWRTAAQAGLPDLGSGDPFRPLLDQGSISLLALTHSYSIFSNQGFQSGQPLSNGQLTPATLLTVQDPDGRLLLDWRTPETRALTTAQLAFLLTDILADVLARAESLGRPNPLEPGRPAAAKLGQTANGQEAWTLGYSPQLTIGIWLGPQTGSLPRPLEPRAAAGLWQAVFRAAHANLEPQAFAAPAGLTRIAVCNPSGLLPTSDCPEVVEELFIPGNEPLFADTLYQAVQVNRQTGRLATVFTPPELIETRVFLHVPPEARLWAEAAGIDLAPEDYDAVFTTANRGTAAILSPAVFSYVRGLTPITGDAAGEGFAYYRLQVGEGLNPRQWLQLGQDRTQPVTGGQLAVWDTSGLDGLYALQLLVVAADNSIQSATIQVTVDNTPPDLQIIFPVPGAVFTFPAERQITLQARAEDTIALERVEFLVNGELVLALTRPPFAAVWSGQPGTHTLTVRAVDAAGNIREASLEFTLQR